ncbi:uncharacterized protein [Palaemon carinicauda]|uniref:uncharacterized protein n=1 Tax=Palaemon carinicauda TaxID=392227 RepID=UPI0035B62A30
MQWSRSIGFVVLTIISFVPSVFVTLLLWYFDALQEGGPLIVVLLIPTLVWCGCKIVKSGQRRNANQNGPEADLPPKYEKVMSEPPPYELLFIGMPLASASTMCPTLRSAALNFSREGPRSCFSFGENCTPGSCWPVPAAGLVAPNEVFASMSVTKEVKIDGPEVKRDGLVGQVSRGKLTDGIKSAGNDEATESSIIRHASEDCTTVCSGDSSGHSLSNNGPEDNTRQEMGTLDDGKIDATTERISVIYDEISDPELPSYEEAYEYMSMS